MYATCSSSSASLTLGKVVDLLSHSKQGDIYKGWVWDERVKKYERGPVPALKIEPYRKRTWGRAAKTVIVTSGKFIKIPNHTALDYIHEH